MTRQVRDTFLRFLADNLDFTVHNLRMDLNVPADDRGFQMNALNVKFLNTRPQIILSEQQVALDLIFDDELTAIDAMDKVWQVLSVGAFTPNKDFTDPDIPVPTGYNIFWEPDGVRFRVVANPLYYHMHCVLTLQYHES